MSEEKQYQFKNYVIGYDKDIRDKSAFTICEKKEEYLLVIGTLYDKSADILDEWLEHLHLENEKLQNIIKEVKEYIEDACYLEETNYPNCLGHKQTMKVLEILDKGE